MNQDAQWCATRKAILKLKQERTQNTNSGIKKPSTHKVQVQIWEKVFTVYIVLLGKYQNVAAIA